MLGDFSLDDIEVRRRLGAEIDRDHLGVRRDFRRQRLQRAGDPCRGRLGEIEIAVDALRDPPRPERREPLVECLADGAEFHIGGVAERKHAELDAVEPRRRIAHQFLVGARRARGRLAFAPGRRDDDQPLHASERGDLQIRHVDEATA